MSHVGISYTRLSSSVVVKVISNLSAFTVWLHLTPFHFTYNSFIRRSLNAPPPLTFPHLQNDLLPTEIIRYNIQCKLFRTMHFKNFIIFIIFQCRLFLHLWLFLSWNNKSESDITYLGFVNDKSFTGGALRGFKSPQRTTATLSFS